MNHPRWEEDPHDGQQKPIVHRIHCIPIENRKGLLHCAQLTCWCSPRPDPEDPIVIGHQAMTKAEDGWVLVGEFDP